MPYREAGHLGAPVPEISFTHDGLEPILKSARTNDLLGATYASCGKSEEAISKFQLAASASAPDQVRWAWLAAQKLPGFDERQWQEHLRSALLQAESRSETSAYPSWWDYTAGALSVGARKQATGRAEFSESPAAPRSHAGVPLYAPGPLCGGAIMKSPALEQPTKK